MNTLRPARPEEIEEVRTLFREYAASLETPLCFTTFEQELAELPTCYELILVDSTLNSCVAMRPWADGAAEMKRLYVRPEARGKGLGKQLTEAVIQAAMDRGYRSIRLDTLPKLTTAIAMYRRMGFQEIANYNGNPIPGVLFFELKFGRIIGIGGVFFKSKDHQSLRAWYEAKLGIQEGARFNNTVWSIFPADSEYFSRECMINYIVDNLDVFLARCAADGVKIDPKREDCDYGRFAWIYDPDGNKIELWQPASQTPA
jgi:GNAT superfamily N-acetyltransferase